MNSADTVDDQLAAGAVREVECLLDELGSSSSTRRAAAEHALRAKGPDAALVLKGLLEPQIRSKKSWRRPLQWLPAVTLITFLAVVTGCIVTRSTPELLFIPIVVVVVCTALLISRDRLPGMCRRQIAALLTFEDKRMLPILFDLRLMAAGYREDSMIAEQIARLFPTLRPADAALITDEQRRRLNDSLQLAAGTDSPYFVAILKGLQQVGDHTSVPVVTRLAQADPRAAVTQAARECLPCLHQRAAMQGHNLLRPVSSESEAKELVRAAIASPADQTALLRAAEPGLEKGP